MKYLGFFWEGREWIFFLWNEKKVEINVYYYVFKGVSEIFFYVSSVKEVLCKVWLFIGIFKVINDYMADGSKLIMGILLSLERYIVIIIGEYVINFEDILDNIYWMY